MLLDRIDAYLDSAPRADCDPVETGPFTLFVSRREAASYYARPSVLKTHDITIEDIHRLTAACRRHNVEPAIEWIEDRSPGLELLLRELGVVPNRYALMALRSTDLVAVSAAAEIRVVGAGDPALLQARGVAEVSFGFGGVSPGPPGVAERDAAVSGLDPGRVHYLQERSEEGLTVTVAAMTDEHGVIAGGAHQPVDHLTEIVAVSTLPAFRGRGLAAAVTSTLCEDAFSRGIDTVLLSAQNDPVERLYRRLGFVTLGAAWQAQW